MKNKKSILVLAVILILGIGVWLWFRSPGADSAKQKTAEKLTPQIKIAALSLKDIDEERINMQASVLIDNPLPVGIKANGLRFTVYIDSIKVVENHYNKPISIESSDSSVIEIPMQVLGKPLINLLKYFTANNIDSADYSFNSVLQLDVPIAGEKDIKVKTTKRLPAYNFPTIKIKDVDFHALDLKGKGVDLVVSFYNPNVFTIKVRNPTFRFEMEDAMEMEAILQKVINVAPKTTQEIAINAKLIEGKLLKSGWKILMDRKDTKFVAKFKSKIESDMKAIDNGNFSATIRGNMEELLNMVGKK
ncbi:LEA type 2 family protein [Dyadobacter sp. CY323]|uniref:NDR1/HIN1-like protein n=1 Tax=Dyadobacter sp. CY323 TaxID=2907302 RepID=UPI001F2DB0C1|nr:LEA type 2 family protein [Dyadobacter sp. CY323]MCE6987990.1 LEA type 2 family protein [Dyadobacter sp. CY323]